MVGLDLARLRAGCGADDHRPFGAACSPTRSSRRCSPIPSPVPGAGCSMRRRERLGEAEVQAFETEGLIGAGAAPAVLSYLFHRIEDRFDGRPTLLIVDEGWLALDDPGFAGQLREWLKTLRKKNASRHLRHPVARRHRRQRHRARHHRELPDPHFPAERARARAADRGDLSALRSQRPADRDPEPGDAEARLLLPVAPRQSPVRARPLRSRARLHRRLVEDRPDRHRRDPRRPRPRRLRRRLAAPQGPRLGGRHAHPQRGGFVMITRRLRAGLIAGVAALSIAAFERSRPRAVDRVRPDQLRAKHPDRCARASAGQQ